MKREKISSEMEQQIVIGMVVSTEFLGQVAPFLSLDLMQAKHLQQIAKWSLDYFKKYQSAPKENIESLYHSWTAEGKADEEIISAVHDVLESLSDQYLKEPTINVPYLLDLAASHFSKRKLEVLKDTLEYHLEAGNKDAAEAAVAAHHPISATMDADVDPLNDFSAWDAAYAESQKPLITWPYESAQSFFGSSLSRDALIAILAPEKRGKTWFCLEFAIRAVSQRRKVALFEVGDMSRSQIMRRLGVRFSRRPAYRKDVGTIQIPKRIKRGEEKEIEIEYKTLECDGVANAEHSKKAVEKFLRGSGIKPKEPHFKLSVHPNSSVSVNEIEAILKRWELYDGFVPDVIIIDYADILAPEPNTGQLNIRDQINSTWKALRRLSQEKHCLVIAPTQADAASYNQTLLDLRNFSEDKRKLSHVTGMLGLNQTKEEKGRGIMRLNWIVLREDNFQTDRCLYVGQCLTLGRAFSCCTL